MIIVIKKADYDAQPFSDLRKACKVYGFVYNTLIRKEFPIVLDGYIIHNKQLVKKSRTKYSTKNLLNQKK